MFNGKEYFKKYKVKDCKTLEEFMDKYCKHERYKGRGGEYANNLFYSHRSYLLDNGYDYISKHESVTGQVVSFYP